MINKIRDFLKEVSVEMGRVSWPGRDELFGSTTVVIASVIILSVAIGICDFIFSKAVEIIIR